MNRDKHQVTAMQMYRVRMPRPTTTIGQGETPHEFVLGKDGVKYVFPNGLVVRSSDNCDPDNDVANLDHDPPLVRCSIIERYPTVFELIDTPSED